MSWQKYLLGDILKRKKTIIEIDPEKEYKLVTIKLHHKGVVLRNLAKGSAIKSTMSSIRRGDFVLSGIDARNGAFGIVPEELEGAVITNDFWCLEPDESKISRDFFLYITTTNFFDFICKQSSDGTTQRIRLQSNRFFNYKIELPKIEEQKIILEKLNFISQTNKNLNSELTHQLDLVKQLRQAFLREVMQGKLLPIIVSEAKQSHETGQQLLAKIKAEKALLIKEKKLKAGLASSQSISLVDDYVIPDNWTWCKADEIFFITKLAGFEYSKHIKLSKEGEIPVIELTNVRPLNIEKKNILYIDTETSLLLDRCALTKKCLLVTFIGAGIGDVSTFDETERWHLAPNVAKVEPFLGCENLLNVKFVNYFLMSDIGQKEIFKHVKATAQPSLSMGTIRDIDIPLPSTREQEQIVAKLEELMSFCDGLEQSIKESQGYNEMLLQQVLREALQSEIIK